MDIFIIALFLILAIAALAWAGVRDDRKTKENLERMVGTPELVKRVYREGPDGDGYVSLHVETVDGQTVRVATHFEADAAEKRRSFK